MTYKEIVDTFKGMGKFSKIIFKYGLLCVTAIVTAAICFRISAGTLMNYYSAMDIAGQLVKCVNPCLGIICLGIVLFESTGRDE
ncbi:MAG: hypothetical protein FWF05_04160 [Oscillospiraceae bacterium]|nr:hypothetical protein [Oscillospiraceae bacterium]